MWPETFIEFLVWVGIVYCVCNPFYTLQAIFWGATALFVASIYLAIPAAVFYGAWVVFN